MNRSDLRAEVRTITQESSTLPFGDPFINDRLNYAQQDLAVLTEYSAAKYTTPMVLNQDAYKFDSRWISMLTMAVTDSNGNLTPLGSALTIIQMDSQFPSWRVSTAGTPARWFTRVNGFYIHPKPDALSDTKLMEVHATRFLPDMTGDGDTPLDLPIGYHRALAKWAAARLLAIDKENPTAQAAAQLWQQEYQADAVRLKKHVAGRNLGDGGGVRVSSYRSSTRP